MFDREKVLSGLECCADPDTECGDCPYFNHTYFYPDCKETLIRSAVELLKADQTYLKEQEPRVLTLEEVANQLKEPAFLETKSRQSYTGWVLVYDVQKGMGITGVRMGLTQPGHITSWYSIDLYDIKWRCWSAKPSDEQMEGTPWGK